MQIVATAPAAIPPNAWSSAGVGKKEGVVAGTAEVEAAACDAPSPSPLPFATSVLPSLTRVASMLEGEDGRVAREGPASADVELADMLGVSRSEAVGGSKTMTKKSGRGGYLEKRMSACRPFRAAESVIAIATAPGLRWQDTMSRVVVASV